jgi:hypothetical protein
MKPSRRGQFTLTNSAPTAFVLVGGLRASSGEAGGSAKSVGRGREAGIADERSTVRGGIVGRSPGAVRVAVRRGLRTLAGHLDATAMTATRRGRR